MSQSAPLSGLMECRPTPHERFIARLNGIHRHTDNLTGDPVRLIRREERYNTSDVVGLSDSPQRRSLTTPQRHHSDIYRTRYRTRSTNRPIWLPDRHARHLRERRTSGRVTRSRTSVKHRRRLFRRGDSRQQFHDLDVAKVNLLAF